MHQVSKILFCHETLHVSGIFFAHHQVLSAVHVTIGMFHAGYVAAAFVLQGFNFRSLSLLNVTPVLCSVFTDRTALEFDFPTFFQNILISAFIILLLF
jgi:hypothetical protein